MYSPTARARAQARIRRLTRTAIVLAGGATAFIWVTVAKEHPGSSAGAKAPAPSSVPTTAHPGTVGTSPIHDRRARPRRPPTDHRSDHERRIELARFRSDDDAHDEPAHDHDDEPAHDHDDPAGRDVRWDVSVAGPSDGWAANCVGRSPRQ